MIRKSPDRNSGTFKTATDIVAGIALGAVLAPVAESAIRRWLSTGSSPEAPRPPQPEPLAAALPANVVQLDAARTRPRPPKLSWIETIEGAQANGHLPGLRIHPKALRAMRELDSSAQDTAFAGKISRALFALDEYARISERWAYRGNFETWSRLGLSENGWPVEKIALTESLRVRRSPKLLGARYFPVDSSLDPRGRRVMLSHLKLSNGRGNIAPRLYFYDDTNGPTGKVHIGFIGPHRHVPTALFAA